MKIMGIDIGTTTVSVVMTDTETGKLLAKETVEHNSFLRSSKPEQKLQDPERIYGVSFAGYDVKFKVENDILTVQNVEKIQIK